MFKFLSKIKNFNVMIAGHGFGVEFFPPSAGSAATPLASAPSASLPMSAKPGSPKLESPVFHRITGTSPGPRRKVPRELDLTLEGDEIQFHIHKPGGNCTPTRVSRKSLQDSLDGWRSSGDRASRITFPARTPSKDLEITFMIQQSGVVEVRENWWILVGAEPLKAALEELGVRVPW